MRKLTEKPARFFFTGFYKNKASERTFAPFSYWHYDFFVNCITYHFES